MYVLGSSDSKSHVKGNILINRSLQINNIFSSFNNYITLSTSNYVMRVSHLKIFHHSKSYVNYHETNNRTTQAYLHANVICGQSSEWQIQERGLINSLAAPHCWRLPSMRSKHSAIITAKHQLRQLRHQSLTMGRLIFSCTSREEPILCTLA